MRQLIEARFPDHGILGEEHGPRSINAEWVWVLDPIDGTKAFAAARIDIAVLSSFEVLSVEAESRGIVDIAGSAALKDWRADTVAWSRAHGGA